MKKLVRNEMPIFNTIETDGIVAYISNTLELKALYVYFFREKVPTTPPIRTLR